MADTKRPTTVYGREGDLTFAIAPATTAEQSWIAAEDGTDSNVDLEINILRQRITDIINNGVVYKGALTSLSGLPTINYKAGWQYVVRDAGTYAGKVCEQGDVVLCAKSYIPGTASDSDWIVLQANIVGAVTGPASAVANHVAIFDGASGKAVKDSGYTIGKSVPSDAVFTDTTYSNVSEFTNDAGYLTQHQDISGKADDSNVVHKSGNESIGGNKTFTNSPTIERSYPILTLNKTYTGDTTTDPTDIHFANNGVNEGALRLTASNDILLGEKGSGSNWYNGPALQLKKDNTFSLRSGYGGTTYQLVGTADGNLTWRSRDVITNGGNQTIGGTKTFTTGIHGNTSDLRLQNDKSGNDGSTSIYGGTGYATGAYLNLFGINHATNPSQFVLVARDTNNTKALIGKPDGSLKWDSKDVITNGGDQTIGGTKTFSSVIAGNITGNAATATKFATARTISAAGKEYVGDASFDGSGNINLNVMPAYTFSYAAGSNTRPYHLLAQRTITGNSTTNVVTFLVNRDIISATQGGFGLLRVILRANAAGAAGAIKAQWLIRSADLARDCVQIGFGGTSGNVYADIFVKVPGTWVPTHLRVLAQTTGGSNLGSAGIVLLDGAQQTGADAYTSNCYASMDAAALEQRGVSSYPSVVIPEDAGLVARASSDASGNEIASKTWVTNQISAISQGIVYKGTVATVSDLPSSGNTTGDLFQVTAANSLYIWNGSAWEPFGSTNTIDQSVIQGSGNAVSGGAVYTALSDLEATYNSALGSYLPLIGGNLTGDLSIEKSLPHLMLVNSTTTNQTDISFYRGTERVAAIRQHPDGFFMIGYKYAGAANWYSGGKIRFSDDGSFSVIAQSTSSNSKTLLGQADGTLTWRGKNVAQSAYLTSVPSSGSGYNPGAIIFVETSA